MRLDTENNPQFNKKVTQVIKKINRNKKNISKLTLY